MIESHSKILFDDLVQRSGDTCFVAMDFSARFNPVYEEIIFPVVTDGGMRPVRSDEVLSASGIVVEEIVKLIQHTRIVIIDITGSNPNVLIELGIAQALRKEMIIVTQDQNIPFDIQLRRVIRYDMSDSGKAKFRGHLGAMLRSSIYPAELTLRQMLHHCQEKPTFVIHGQVTKEHIDSVHPPVDEHYMERLSVVSSETMGIWDLALAYQKISWSLGHDVSRLVSTDGRRAPEDLLERGNAFVFGGPGANPFFEKVTRIANDLYNNALGMKCVTNEFGKNRFYLTMGDSVYPDKQDELLEQSRDVGMVMRLPNPYLDTGTIWLAAGVRTYGTEAAIQLLVTPSLINSMDIKEKLSETSTGIWAVVQASFSQVEKKLHGVKVLSSGLLEKRVFG